MPKPEPRASGGAPDEPEEFSTLATGDFEIVQAHGLSNTKRAPEDEVVLATGDFEPVGDAAKGAKAQPPRPARDGSIDDNKPPSGARPDPKIPRPR